MHLLRHALCRLRVLVLLRFAASGLWAVLLATAAQAQYGQAYPQPSEPSGPIRLRQPSPMLDERIPGAGIGDRVDLLRDPMLMQQAPRPYRPGEFELFVQRLANAGRRPADVGLMDDGRDFPATEDERFARDPARGAEAQPRRRPGEIEIRRFGAELMLPPPGLDAADYSPVVPPDYVLNTGDELVITLWGSVDADLRVTIDRSGRVTIPRVGPVRLAGVRYSDADDTIRRRVARVFRNFDLSVSLGRLRGVRVYVTGFVDRPGAYTVTSLSTVMNALIRAGGPTAAGSFRQIELRRNGRPPVNLDLYDFLLRGERSGDVIVQAGDVIHVGAVGPQAGVIGSVNKPAVFELEAGETVADAIAMAGGFTAVADRSRIAIERLADRDSVRMTELTLPGSGSVQLSSGDVLRAFSVVDVALPVERQNKHVWIEGEVLRPGEYVLPAESSIADALQAAGGLTESAYLFGTEFSRESVRLTQQENYERALSDLETQFTLASSTQRTVTADEAAAQAARVSATSRLVARLRQIKPTGRIVLHMQPDSRELPNLALEDGDRIYVPPLPTTVGVFGSVFNAGSYLYGGAREVDDYLRLAGGPTRGADKDSTFVIRANGSVVSARQNGGWFSDGLSGVQAEPGDTIFVPEKVDKTTFVQHAKDWTQILYQFGLGVAAIRAFRN